MRLRRLGLCILILAGCKTASQSSSIKDDQTLTPAPAADGPRLCAGIRGNGNLIFAHFAAMARILETYGMVDATAGGSSGSITQFLYESMYANPVLRQCATGDCTNAEAGARASLFFKSLIGYLGFLGTTDEATAFQQLLPLAQKIQAAGNLQGVEQALASNDPATNQKIQKAIQTVLTSQDIRDIVNTQELFPLLADTAAPDPQYGSKEVWAAVTTLGNWKVDSNIIFFRPGVINFKGLARKLGRVGSFYAGYGPADAPGTKAFLDACAAPGVGKEWNDIMALPGPGGHTCGDTFFGLLKTYRTKLLANEASFPSRADDPVGKYLPVLISTSVLEGADAVNTYNTARQAYLAGTQPVPFPMTFDGIRFGYWGRPADLDRVASNPKAYPDLKTSKFIPLGQDKWADVLSLSPAEPGLARLLPISGTRISAGGWSDLHPSLVLKNLGCQSVVYVTRRGEESDFAKGVARQFGVTDDQLTKLYSLDTADGQAPSSQALSVAEADGVWCTDWNKYDTPQLSEMTNDAYNAPFEARANAPQALVPYANSQAAVNFRGCTPGAPALPPPGTH